MLIDIFVIDINKSTLNYVSNNCMAWLFAAETRFKITVPIEIIRNASLLTPYKAHNASDILQCEVQHKTSCPFISGI